MPISRFEPSTIKNKYKREEIARKNKRAKGQAKLQRRLEIAKQEAKDPAAKKVRVYHLGAIFGPTFSKERLNKNIPRTLDNTREYDPSFLTVGPSPLQPKESAPALSSILHDISSAQPSAESAADIASDLFAGYFATDDPTQPPKVLITTSRKATKITYEFCDELAGIFPGSEFHKRPKGKGFEMGAIAGWAAKRGYSNLIVVNEDTKKPSASAWIQC
jgi:ribosome production factor 1